MINPTNLKPEEIIKTMWFVFGISATYKNEFGNLTENNAKTYLFDKVLPILKSHGYIFKKTRNKKLSFGDIEEDFHNMDRYQKQSASVDRQVIEWLKEYKHLPSALKCWSDLSEVNMGIYLSDKENDNLISPRASLILLTDYFLWYMGMCGFKLTKIRGSEDRLYVLRDIYAQQRIKNLELILNAKI